MENLDGEYIGCCTKSDFINGWIQLPIFKVKYCRNCEEATMDCNLILEKIWELFFAPFWNGNVYLK